MKNLYNVARGRNQYCHRRDALELSADDLKHIYFLTHTSLSEERIKRASRGIREFYGLVDNIMRINRVDFERDWAVYDYEYRQANCFYGRHRKIVPEELISKDSFPHKCRDGRSYLVQIIGEEGFCPKCDTQFFPQLWWSHPFRNNYSYHQIKYDILQSHSPAQLEESYRDYLLSLGVDERILDEALKVCHSQEELEKLLNTRNFDRLNPPDLKRLNYKLLTFSRVWKIKPVRQLGIYSGGNYFFHNCCGSRPILFEEKQFYPWCRNCFTKFIPISDKVGVESNREQIKVEGFVEGANSFRKPPTAEEEERMHYLSILELREPIDRETVLGAYRRLSKIYHPDSGGTNELFQMIGEAKDWLLKS